jgi:transcription factor IIIB subunit 2
VFSPLSRRRADSRCAALIAAAPRRPPTAAAPCCTPPATSQADSHEKAQQRGRYEISHLVDLLGIRPREESVESAHRLYKLALQHGFTRGRRTNQVAAACLYLLCRQDGKPFLLIDFSDALQARGSLFLECFWKFCV